MIRVPVDLADRLDAMAAELLASYIEGRTRLPNEHCEAVPLHYVIRLGLEALEGHRKRSRSVNRPGRRREREKV